MCPKVQQVIGLRQHYWKQQQKWLRLLSTHKLELISQMLYWLNWILVKTVLSLLWFLWPWQVTTLYTSWQFFIFQVWTTGFLQVIKCTINSLWPSDAIWRQRTGSTLAQVMACCLMAPSHYLNQCWLIISEVLRHSPEGNFTGNAPDIYHWYDWKWQI